MKEYIEREAALKAMSQAIQDRTWSMDDFDVMIKMEDNVAELPAADVVPVIHGRWYDEDSFDAHGSPIYRCSVCNKTVADNYISCHKFCLHCGARMDGDTKREVGFYKDPKNYNISQRLADGGNE